MTFSCAPASSTHSAPNDFLCWYRPHVGVALARFASGPGHVDAAEVHLVASLADRELDRPPAEQVERARVVAPGRLVVAAVDGRQPPAVAVQEEPGERVAAGCLRLEVDEVTGPLGGRPPADERRARPEREVAPLAGLQQQVVEAVERDRGRLLRRAEALPQPAPAQPRVVADDDDAARLGLADPLPGRLRDPLERRLLVGPGERQRHPVARRLDLLDRVEAGPGEGVGVVRGRRAPRRRRRRRRRPRPRAAPRPRRGGPRRRPREPVEIGPRGTYALNPPIWGHGRSSARTPGPPGSTM